MILSSADRAIADAAYARSKQRAIIPGALLGVPIAIMGPSIMEGLRNPHATHRQVIVYSVFLGFVLAASAVASFFITRQRKQDLEIVRFFEKHFPDECSWKQEENILAQAEDIRLKAKVANAIQSHA